MRIIKNPKELQETLLSYHKHNTKGLIPTMGALHEGHFSLVKRSLNENEITIVSLFVNPTQFNNSSDLENYPSTLEDDLKSLKELGVEYVFTPSFEDVYPDEYRYEMIEKELSKGLCGKDRPGHFNGVLSIVLKLFQITQATRAYFGEKDYQQLQLIRGMVDAFFMPIEVIAVPTVRDEMGLAMSSRNKRLSEEGLKRAQNFAKALHSSFPLEEVAQQIENLGIKIDYLEEKQGRRFAAVQLENVRLIDNVSL